MPLNAPKSKRHNNLLDDHLDVAVDVARVVQRLEQRNPLPRQLPASGARASGGHTQGIDDS